MIYVKNSLLYICLIVLIIVLGGCANDEKSLSTDNPIDSIHFAGDSGTTDLFEFKKKVFVDSSHKNSNIKISYPQIISDTVDLNTVNKVIYEQIISFPNFIYGTDYTDLEVNIDYKVFLSDEFISIAFNGWGNVKSAAYPTDHYFTINFSLDNYKRICLGDVYKVDTSFVNLFKTALLEQYDKEIVEIFEADYNDEDIYKELLQCDQEGSFCYSCFLQDKIIISMPVRHIGGDHLEVSIPFEMIQDNFFVE